MDNSIRNIDPDGMQTEDGTVDGGVDPNEPGLGGRIIATVLFDIKHAIFNTANRAVGSPYRERYSKIDGQEVFQSEIYKEETPKTFKQAAKQTVGAVTDALAVIPFDGQIGGLLAKTGSEATFAREGDEYLVRFGQEGETTQSLADQSANAEANGYPHGVSTKKVNKLKGSDLNHKSALMKDVQKAFKVAQTGNRPSHYTVFLPNPVTDETTELFNLIFKPISPSK